MRLLIKSIHSLSWLLVGLLVAFSGFAVSEVINDHIIIDDKNFTLVSSRRVTRTVSEYKLRVLAQNVSAVDLSNVKASLISAPTSISIIQGNLAFGAIPANSSVLSSNDFTIQINLREAYNLADLVWKIDGDLPPPPPPPSTSPTAVGIFMKIDGPAIKGEVESSSHKDWIQVLAWSEGSSNSGTTHVGGGAGAGSFMLGNVNVTKYIDTASNPLRLAIAKGELFEEVQIDVIKQCGTSLYTQYAITLSNVMVVGLSSGGSGGEDRLTENVAFNTAMIQTMYTPVGDKCRFQQPIYSIQSYN
ncbi:Hcp family type VI secretion system effector [Rheinheimera sp. UJ63]|uniref:Hcp family type VI secretion system effector n=1 Tax=Rheinheimera sp. UJ63 TaxID=2910157 RepID=UPI001F363745|nr:type VI secretion system tube protein Hcp [Rheinheimera sp. UJ63]MCF4009172.1 type VI secretion system tube protein Hcp [Rheinheimera sp. UJ63]